MNICNMIEAWQDEIIAHAHHLHRNPELSMQEFNTTAYIRDFLLRQGIELFGTLPTGVVAVIRGAGEGRTVALRADMDALPIVENESHAVRSCHHGRMHACGHDFHTAALLGAAKALQAARETFSGTVLLLFQPAEETSEGAALMMQTGAFETFAPAGVFAFHVAPSCLLGTVALIEGPFMAAQKGFTITVRGKGGHGASPQKTVDPIAAAVQVISGLQLIAARKIDPSEPFVLSVCSLHGGSVFNVIPDEVTISGTCRYLNADLEESIKVWITQIADHTAQACGCSCEIGFFHEIPALLNSPVLSPVAEAAACEVFGRENLIRAKTIMGSEDFALYAQKAPIYMYHVGYQDTDWRAEGWHNSNMVVPDQTAVLGAKLLALSALRFLSGRDSISKTET